ncbi:FxsA family protein [Motiliproteus sp.]|uniref:FxsA family protein n=1 Tax=Motiliproteus sp. TaxID=1898955 RepID=UPI003BAD0958
MPFLFLIFVVVPLIEIVLLINVGQAIGAWYTIGLVLLSAFIGVNMLRLQGLSTLLRARSRMESGEIPAQEMIEGIILAVGGALLVTPGFVTDFIGFCCLIPVTRRGFVKRVKKHFTVIASQQMHGGSTHQSQTFYSAGSSAQEDFQPRRPNSDAGDAGRNKGGQTIDGEYRRDD